MNIIIHSRDNLSETGVLGVHEVVNILRLGRRQPMDESLLATYVRT